MIMFKYMVWILLRFCLYMIVTMEIHCLGASQQIFPQMFQIPSCRGDNTNGVWVEFGETLKCM
jgi:hypothetical protein